VTRRTAIRVLRAIPQFVLAPLLVGLPLISMAVADLLWFGFGRRRTPSDTMPRTGGVSIVIPTWNGRHHLETHLESVAAAAGALPESEIIVVDNASTDGTAEMLAGRFPDVRLLRLDRNLGFGGGSNAGFRAAQHDIVVLLNNDMRVDPGFLAPLIAGFTDEKVFAVSCQIFFRDPKRLREETGLTQGWWENGSLRVRHRIDEKVTSAFPCFYGGGGSCAFDKRKFFELGGFDNLLSPFYLEDTDLGFQAWKRGWKVLYEPRSVVWHEHRGTIGRRFTAEQIDTVLYKNYILFNWKNIHEWRRLWSHFAFLLAGAVLGLSFGDWVKGEAMWRAFRQLPGALRSRWRARSLAAVSDTEAFRRPLGGYFRDRFQALELAPEKPAVLFVSPYPICPPVHGGGVFMLQTLYELTPRCRVHLLVLLDAAHQAERHAELVARCASAEFLERLEGRPKQFGSIVPFAVREFENGDLEWALHRACYVHEIDVVQLEYMPMGQYGCEFRRIVTVLFEHDIYFQSIARSYENLLGVFGRVAAAFEYLRAVRYELRLLPRFDRIQVCSAENKRYLASFLPSLNGRIDDDLRAGIDASRYEFRCGRRDPYTMLFLGSFRHAPNQHALTWFAQRVAPLVFAGEPRARLIVIGSDPPPRHSLPAADGRIELRGFVDDVREPLARCAVFVCPILGGSGVRVKLLEAFAAGIPVVSTRLGAEGLASEDGVVCALADEPEEFAAKILRLFERPEEAEGMAHRARAEVETRRSMPLITARLAESYREAVAAKRRAAIQYEKSATIW
jgi:GT2 family glycosyltransferase